MRYLFVIGVFAVGLACGIIGSTLAARQQARSTKVEPGTEVVSILEDEVMSIVLRTDEVTFSAQRSRPAAAFAVQVTYVDGRPTQQCQASPDLARHLAAYSTITAKRQLQSQPQAEKEFPVQVGTLELRDRMVDEPAATIRLRASSDRRSLAALYDDVAVEVTNSEGVFTKLEEGCRFLGEHGVP